MIHRVSFVVLLLIAASPRAQTCAYNWGTEPLGPGGNTATLLSSIDIVYRSHVLVPAAVFQNVPLVITDLSVAVAGGYRRLKYTRLTIRMGHTTVNQLATTFAPNITSPLQDVLVANEHVFFEGFGPAWIPVGLQTPFQFLPGSGNLLIEVVTEGGLVLDQATYQSPAGALMGGQVYGVGTTLPIDGNPTTAPRLRFCTDRAEAILSGETCNGSAGSTPLLGVTGRPAIGSTTTLWLSDAPANAPAACAWGFATTPPFPLLLTTVGAPGCQQYFTVAVADLVAANPVGVGQRTLAVPNTPSLVGAIAYAQYYVLDPPANALGVTASNYARLLVGL
ncbi:MAG: hypothetical protein WAT39_10555 [Planctomycetota bacterium]